MADPISLASGAITFVVFALQASKKLYQTIDSFKSNKRTVRELSEELKALQGVLENLQESFDINDTDLRALELPLQRCGKACEDFELVIKKCSSDSSGVRAIRDWAKVQYMGNDITGFRVLLAGYKSTIMIAICDANMRTTKVTAKLLDEYKTMIQDTTSELEDQLEEINKKLEQLANPRKQPSFPGYHGQITQQDKSIIEEDKRSIEQCLAICVQVSEHIDRVQTPSLTISSRSSGTNSDMARQITTEALTGCKTELSNTTGILKRQLSEIQSRLAAISDQPGSIGSEVAKQEIERIKQCLAICSKASEQVTERGVHVFEDVKMEDDGHQVLVATLGDLLSAKRVTAGARSVQWLGQMSDESLQHLATKRTVIHPQDFQQQQHGGEPQTYKFEGRHGHGRTLN